jgi:hypothetical protein
MEKSMRKSSKRLALNRETLRSLEEGAIRQVAGGAVTQVDCTLVNGSCISTAPSCFNCSGAAVCSGAATVCTH